MRQPDGSSAMLTTKVETMLAWARKNSLWPLPFGTACCGIEFMSVVSSHYDLARFGAEVDPAVMSSQIRKAKPKIGRE